MTQIQPAYTVFIHGFMGHRVMWLPVLNSAAALGFRCHMASVPGHGGPALMEAGADFDVTVDTMAKQLPNDGPVHLVGYSMGARLALALAIRHPNRVRTALLVGGTPGIEDDVKRQKRARWDQRQAEHIRAEGVEKFIDRWQALPMFASQEHLSAEVLAAQRRQREQNTANGLAWAMEILGQGAMPSYWEALETCEVPLRLLTGRWDTKYCEIAKRMANVAPNAGHRIVSGAGHNVVLEAPGVVAKEVLAHAREHRLAESDE
jgi:2-succinyl-6-hydroxy-2,4-cyclohexadiene-1-carboxylate synthase